LGRVIYNYFDFSISSQPLSACENSCEIFSFSCEIGKSRLNESLQVENPETRMNKRKEPQTIVVQGSPVWCRWWDSNPLYSGPKSIESTGFSQGRVKNRVKLSQKFSHMIIYQSCEGIFFVSDCMLVYILKHVIRLVPHSFHLIFVGDSQRMSLRCSEVA